MNRMGTLSRGVACLVAFSAFSAMAAGLIPAGYTGDLAALPIPDQSYDNGEPCRPEFVVSNRVSGATWTIGGDIASPLFDVEYAGNAGIGRATVTIDGKGEFAGTQLSHYFYITADENISTGDLSVRRLAVDGKSVYVFTNAAAAQAVTARRGILLADSLLVGGGGAGGNTMGGGGGWNGSNKSGGAGGSGTVILVLKPMDFDIEPIPRQILVSGGCYPEPVVRLQGEPTVLTKDVDYEVGYTNNTTAGMALVTVSGLGTHVGKVGYARFDIRSLYFAKPAVTQEGDGLSWATAMSVTNLFATLAVVNEPSEVWLAAGTVSAPVCSITNNSPLTIRGGFAGTETALEERQDGPLTVFDGGRVVNCPLRISNAADAGLVIDRLKFCNARGNGFIKVGDGGLKVHDCAIEANGRDIGTVFGRGMNVQSGGAGTLVVSNCVFAGNRNVTQDNNYGGSGIYIKSFKSAVIDNSLFVTNGYDLTTPAAGGWCGYYARGSAIYADSSPITVRGSRFAGNCCPVRAPSGDGRWGGGTITLTGASGGSLIDHCVFIGNTERLSYQPLGGIDCGGTLVVNMNTSTDKVTVNHCTFAYNITHAEGSAGGITVVKGDVAVNNTILWKNSRYHLTTVGYGSDVQVQSGATAKIRHSLVTDLDGTALVGAGLTVASDSVIAADPRLVTTLADFEGLLTVGAANQYYTPGIYAELAAMDAHLLSVAGYLVNGGAAGPATDAYSPAIDAGDPAADYSLERMLNGGRLNLGAFGNTGESSLSTSGQPKADVEVLFPDGMTRPLIRITMGLDSGDGYSATVHMACSTGGVTLAEETYQGVAKNDVMEYSLPLYLPVGTEVTATVTITAFGADEVSYTVTEAAAGGVPPFFGKGGGSHVIHVRTGADCRMNGSDWTDAYPDLASAFASVPDESKTEVWLAVTNGYMTQAVTLSYPLTIRGGFAGTENSPAERPEGKCAYLWGNSVWRTMEFNVPADALLTVERIRFAKSSTSELKKGGKGDLLVRDCWFTDSNQNGSINGRGIYAAGGTVSITNCQFLNLLGPREIGDASTGGDAIYLNSCTRAYIDDCLFVTNGTWFSTYHPGWSRHKAGAVYVNSTPTIFRNCRFAAVCAAQRHATDGGVVCFVGACDGSKMINCALVGNSDFESSRPANGYSGGAIACEMSSRDMTLDVENCTVAFNLSQGYGSAAGINVYKGTVNVRNSIIYGNIRGKQNSFIAGADIDVKTNATLNIAYSLITGLTTNYLKTTGGTINIGQGVITADPLMITTTNDFQKLLSSGSGYWSLPLSATPACAAFDVHLRSPVGYMLAGRLIRYPGETSPAIDAGDPLSDYSGEPVLAGIGGNGRRVNLGAYGNTAQAAMSRIRGMFLIIK